MQLFSYTYKTSHTIQRQPYNIFAGFTHANIHCLTPINYSALIYACGYPSGSTNLVQNNLFKSSIA